MIAELARKLCNIGLHKWLHVSGLRHHHVECDRCGARGIRFNADIRQGYQPWDPTWPRPPAR